MIREATAQDIPRVVVLAEQFYNEVQEDYFPPFDEDSVVELCGTILAGLGVIFVAEVDGYVVGFLAAVATPHLFNKATVNVQEVAWFVSEEHRGGSLSVRLYVALEGWAARREDVTILTMGARVTSPPRIRAFYRHRGYTEQETGFSKGVVHVGASTGT